MTANESRAPVIALQQDSIEPVGAPGLWKIGWRVENHGGLPIQLITVRLPHGQFKSEEQPFEPNTELGSGERTWFHVTVRCREPAGMVTENAFLIFHVLWREETWRIFVRIRVVVNSKGEPETAVESITTQKVGFSGTASWVSRLGKVTVADKEKDLYILRRMRGWHSNWGVGFEETTGMVSNSLKISQQDIIKALKRLKREQSDNPEYQKLRRDLPKDWPC